MILEFVKAFQENQSQLREYYQNLLDEDKFHLGYHQIVQKVIELIVENSPDYYPLPDKDRIHVIDDGEYQGTLLFIIPEEGYQPHSYYFVKISYGSCSGCDTLQAIMYDSLEKVNDIMTLSLHIVQSLKVLE